MEVKKKPRAEYMRKYRKANPPKGRRITLTLSDSEYSKLKSKAKNHGMPLATYMKVAVHSYHELNLIYPRGIEEKLSSLIGQIRRIGTNINQMARHVNSVQSVAWGELREVRASLKELEKRLNDFIRNPSR